MSQQQPPTPPWPALIGRFVVKGRRAADLLVPPRRAGLPAGGDATRRHRKTIKRRLCLLPFVQHFPQVFEDHMPQHHTSHITHQCACYIMYNNVNTHSLTHSPTHPLTHALTHSLTNVIHVPDHIPTHIKIKVASQLALHPGDTTLLFSYLEPGS